MPDYDTAYHEAGHAVAAAVLGCAVVRVTLAPPLTRVAYQYADLMVKKPVVCLTGPLAEARWRGVRCDYKHAGTDLQMAGSLCFEPAARALVAVYWPRIERVAAALIGRGELAGGEVCELVDAPTGALQAVASATTDHFEGETRWRPTPMT